MLTPAQTDQFRRDGYLIVRGAFSAAELTPLRAAAERVRAKAIDHIPPGTRFWFGRGVDPATLNAEQRARATWGVNEITRPELFEPLLIDVFAHPQIAAALTALLDQPRAWGIKLLWTPRLTAYDLHWHRDIPLAVGDAVQYKPHANDQVQFNAALGSDPCFVVVPGSHRRALTVEEFALVESESTAPHPDQVETMLEPGDVLFMDAHALHRGRSSTDGERLTLHYSAQAQWVPLTAWGEAPDFAWITSDAFLARIAPTTRPYYLRLRSAARAADPLAYLIAEAEAHGWRRPPAPPTSAERL